VSNHLIPLAIISGAHGIRGQVKLHALTADPLDVTSYGKLQDKAGKEYDLKIISCNNDIVIAEIKGITTRNESEALRNIKLFVPRDALPETDNDEYYLEDLIGCQVKSENGEDYGIVGNIINFGAGDIIEIKLAANNEKELFPFTKATFPKIDIKNQHITINPPENVE